MDEVEIQSTCNSRNEHKAYVEEVVFYFLALRIGKQELGLKNEQYSCKADEGE